MQNCPQCGSKTDVYDSRLSQEGEFRRKRKCRGCGYRYATIEVLDAARPLDQEPRVAKPKPEPKPKREKVTKKVSKPVREQRVRRYDEEEYTHSHMDYDVQDVVRDLGIGDFT